MPGKRLSRIWDVSAWSLATKLAISFCLVVLVFMVVGMALHIKHARDREQRDEQETLQDLADEVAERLDQLIIDSKQRVSVLAGDNELEQLLRWDPSVRADAIAHMSDPASEGGRTAKSVSDAIGDLYRSVRRESHVLAYAAKKERDKSASSDPSRKKKEIDEFVFVNITDRDGRVVFHSDSRAEGRGTPLRPDDPGFSTLASDRVQRPYFAKTKETPNEAYVSNVHAGTASPEKSYITFSHAIVDDGGSFLGVALFALDWETIGAFVPELGSGRDPSLPTGSYEEGQPLDHHVLLVDRHGAVLSPFFNPTDRARNSKDSSQLLPRRNGEVRGRSGHQRLRSGVRRKGGARLRRDTAGRAPPKRRNP